MKYISIKGAKVHNLKNIDIDIPRNSLTVITGPSGSGKSSLAFDTIYAEGQRRYVESLSSYARQFLGQMEAPDVESITGLSPAIAIDQKSTSKNPRSTVGTITEVYDYLRVFYARVGDAYCPVSGDLLKSQSAQKIVDDLLDNKDKTKLHILAPILTDQKGEHKELLGRYLSMGFSKIRVNGKIQVLDDKVKLHKTKKNNAQIIIDRVIVKDGVRARLTDSIEQGLKIGDGKIFVLVDETEKFYSENLYSPKSGVSYPELEPRLFSFNSPIGACDNCNGLGVTKVFDRSKYIESEDLSIKDGAIIPLGKSGGFYYTMVKSILKEEGVQETDPISDWPQKVKDIIFEGTNKVYKYSFKSKNASYEFNKAFPGLDAWLNNRYLDSNSDKIRSDLEKYMMIEECPVCKGQRLNDYARHVKVNDIGIMQICAMSIEDAYTFFKGLKFKGNKKIIADKLLKEINNRLRFLVDVGLTYLTLNRSSATLSGGEAQRIRLATQIGSALSGVLYVLDEPSIGLHQRDNDKLIKTLINLRDLGNTVIVVEHDEDTMLASDYLIDIGPFAGVHGGNIVSQGSVEEVKKTDSITANYLSKKMKIEVPKSRRKSEGSIEIIDITKNNLNKLNVTIPLKVMACISGVSGSGKSTLIHNAVVPGVKNKIRRLSTVKNCFKSIKINSDIDQVIEIDQSAIGRTPKSNPATYTKLFDKMRLLYSSTNESKVRGYKQGRFSFNVKGGRCETCEGNGSIKIEMNFLPDVFIKCQECEGQRYNKETLSITYRGKNIAEVLNMTIEEAMNFFENHKLIFRALKTMNDVGLGYLKLGQSSTTLSGGEAQRLKLSRELSKSTKGHCLYVLDEPTTGLHFKDVQVLLHAMNKLVDQGHSMIVIEHNLDVIKSCDHVIDLGPDGGVNGGQIVAEGTPEKVAKTKKSITGTYLKKLL